jgi:formiminotetrahydrofolate cyclodeaminase
MLAELTLAELLERTAAGAALAQMVAGLTTGRPQYAEAAPAMNELAASAERLRAELLAAMERDAEAYTGVMTALRLPKSNDREKALRDQAVQDATREAARVPLTVAEMALKVMALAQTAVRRGNANALSDGAVGALLARAALQGALCNVRINLHSIRDKAFTARMRAKAADLERRAAEREAAVLAAINF